MNENTTFKMVRKSETNEWIVRTYINGKLRVEDDYYTDSKVDAEKTLAWLRSGYEKSEDR